ncbi:MAG: histone family protein [Thermocladium sp.]|jgi:archaeal histone|nr:MAG: histone [Thermocladium sp. ECH_B]
MPEIPLAPVDRIFKKAGAERVGEDAVQALRDVLESIAYDLANRSIEMSKHANRKTITAEDVRAVIRIIRCVPLSV